MIKFQNNKSKKSSTSSESSDNQNPNNNKQQRRNSKKQRNSSVTSLFITSSNNNSNKSGKKMPAKAPIYLKNGYKDGKKLREILSTEMISPPLGDVRHTAHVGRGADDMFGDTKFLMEKELLQQQQAEAAQQQQGGGVVGECSGATNMGSTASSEPSLTDDIIQQNPVTGGIATLRRNGNHFWRSSSHKNKSRHLSSNTDENVTRNSSGDHDDVTTQQHQIMTSQQQRGHHGDNLSIYEGWGVDMGPSILDDVMRVMDNVEQL